MKSNPYVGWFRHSPPTTRLSEKWKWKQLQQQQRQQYQTSSQQKNKMLWYTMPSALPSCKNSPHIGWFRHAPPSRLDCHVIQKPVSSSSAAAATSTATTMTPEEKQLILKLVEELTQHHSRKSSSCDSAAAAQQPWIVSGRLPGGGKEYLEGTKSRRYSAGSSRYVQELLQESSREGTLNTVNALSRLASWFLFPVAYDAESCGYHQHERDYTTTTTGAPPKRRSSRSRKREAGLLRHLSPYLSTFLEEETPRQEKYARYATTTAEDHRDDGNGNDDESDDSDSDSVASSLANSPPMPQNLNCSRDLSLSVSSLAEAYYAHQATTKDMVVAPSPEISRATIPVACGYEGSPLNPHRLDYDITQMDIARMTRNAARHLDVQSILSLPVITYQKGVTIKPLKKQQLQQQQQQQQEGWSWTMVEEDVSIPALGEEIIPEAGAIKKEGEVDFCVICMEHFANGDRLRVLPCDHSFVSTSRLYRMDASFRRYCYHYHVKVNMFTYPMHLLFQYLFTACWMH